MIRIKYNSDLMKFIALFESLTQAKAKDCFLDANGLLYFIVQENQIGKAVGKNGVKVKQIEKALNRKIKIVEFNPSSVQFVRNLLYPLKVKSVWEEGGLIKIEAEDSRTRGLIIGRNAKNLRNYESIVKRYFKIDELKVVQNGKKTSRA